MKFFNQFGDTIVEVLVSIAVLAVVLGVAFESTATSLREGTDAANRNTAVQLAEQQIARIQNSIQTSPNTAFPSTFCMDNSGINKTSGACDQTPFKVSDTYNSNHTFTITCSWQGTKNTTMQVQFYYHSLNAS